MKKPTKIEFDYKKHLDLGHKIQGEMIEDDLYGDPFDFFGAIPIKGEGMPIQYDIGADPGIDKPPSKMMLFKKECIHFYIHVLENVFDVPLGLGYSLRGYLWMKFKGVFNEKTINGTK